MVMSWNVVPPFESSQEFKAMEDMIAVIIFSVVVLRMMFFLQVRAAINMAVRFLVYFLVKTLAMWNVVLPSTFIIP